MIEKSILHYKINRKLGQGGMGVVYLAEDTRLKRNVAIKFLPDHIAADPEQRKRFETEAQAAASLNHPNITTIHAIEDYDEHMFIAMEYIDGIELKDKIRVGSIPLKEAAGIAVQIAEGLNAAHKKGIIHRDIKSQNIMLTADGIVKIMDFGLAKIPGSTHITKSGSTMGTAAYMSPEQAQGQDADERSDIFSYGIVFYEMLAGTLPFKGDYEYALIYSIINEEPDETILTNNAVPIQLRRVVLKCLRKNKEDRYASFDEVLKNILSFSQDESYSYPDKDLTAELSPVKSFIPQIGSNFSGREQEMNTLTAMLENCKRNKGYTVFIGGEPGIGKTQLVSGLVKNHASERVNFLYGRCLFNNEGGLPYHPFVSAVNNSLFSGHGHFISALTAIAEKNNINISNKLSQVKTFLNFSGEYSKSIMHKEQLWEAVLTMFMTIAADKPLVLILDDIQWADKTSVALFAYLARNIKNLPVLLIGLYRPPEITQDDTDLIGTIRQLRIEDAASRIDLLRLSNKDTLNVIQKILGENSVDNKIVSEIYRQSEGNPLFIYELTRLMRDRNAIKKGKDDSWIYNEEASLTAVSDKVQDVIRQRVDRLDDDSREVLQFAACQGEYFQSSVLIDCLKLDKISLLKKLQLLEKEYNVIHYENKNYRFDHILIKDVLYDSILPELREEYHKLIAGSLIESFGSKDEYASVIAHHLISGGSDEQSVKYLLTAAKAARELYAVEEAISFYKKLIKIDNETGLDKNCRKSMEEGLGDINLFTGNPDEALTHFSKFSELANSTGDINGKIRGLRKSAECYRITGRLNEAEDLCTKAVNTAFETGSIDEKIESLNTLASVYASKADYEKMIKVSNEAMGYCKEIKDAKNLSVCLGNLGTAYWHLGNYPQASEQLKEAASIQRNLGDTRGLSTTLNFLALARLKQGDFEDALKAGLESIEIKTKIGDGQKIPGGLNAIGDIYREIGDVDKAIQYHEKSLSLAREYHNKGSMCDNLRDLGEDFFLKGDFNRALKYYHEVQELAASSGIKWYETRTLISFSEFYLHTGSLEEAEKYIDAGLKYSYEIAAKDLIIEALWNKAKIQAKTKASGDVNRMFDEAISIARSVGHKTFLWKLLNDYAKFLSSNKSKEETGLSLKEVREEAHEIVRLINRNIKDENLRKIFLNTLVEKEIVPE